METRLLLVEDNSQDIQLLREKVQQIKLQHSTSQNFSIISMVLCKDAISYIEKQQDKLKIDLMLLDLNLPDGHGTETINKFRPYINQFPILILTGMNDEEIAIKAVQMGFQDYLQKNQITPDSLYKCMNYAIERFKIIQNLRESEERYRILFNGVSDAIIILEKDKENHFEKISDLNDTATQFFNLSREKLLEFDLLTLFENQSISFLREINTKIIAEKHLIFETEFYLSGMKPIPVEIDAHLFSRQNKEFLLWMIRDISSLKQTENSILFDHSLMNVLNDLNYKKKGDKE